jgi:hypothetical protein
VQPPWLALILPIAFVTADQAQKALRVHFMAVRTHGALLCHRPAIGKDWLVEAVGKLASRTARAGVRRTCVRSHHGKLPSSKRADRLT